MEQSGWSVTRPHCGQAFHKLESFLTPSSSQRPNDTSRHGGVLSTSVPCPPGSVDPGRPWLCRPVSSKGAADCDVHSQLSSEKQRKSRSENLQWPCRHWPPLQDSCRGASRCNGLLLRLIGRSEPRSSLAPAPASAVFLNDCTQLGGDLCCPTESRIRTPSQSPANAI